MPKTGKPDRMKTGADEDGEATANAQNKFKGELLKMNESESSDSDPDLYRAKKDDLPKRTKRLPYARRKTRISQFVREAPPPAFVMKLFDRSVDLTQFTPDTPLYPICRAWFRNSPKEKRDPLKKKEDHQKSSKDVLRLPLPYLPGGEYAPSPVSPPKVSEDFCIDYDPLIPLPTKEDLMTANLEQWASAKARVKKASAKRERRYEQSLKIIRSICSTRR